MRHRCCTSHTAFACTPTCRLEWWCLERDEEEEEEDEVEAVAVVVGGTSGSWDTGPDMFQWDVILWTHKRCTRK